MSYRHKIRLKTQLKVLSLRQALFRKNLLVSLWVKWMQTHIQKDNFIFLDLFQAWDTFLSFFYCSMASKINFIGPFGASCNCCTSFLDDISTRATNSAVISKYLLRCCPNKYGINPSPHRNIFNWSGFKRNFFTWVGTMQRLCRHPKLQQRVVLRPNKPKNTHFCSDKQESKWWSTS